MGLKISARLVIFYIALSSVIDITGYSGNANTAYEVLQSSVFVFPRCLVAYKACIKMIAVVVQSRYNAC
jgi:hypothetical protein